MRDVLQWQQLQHKIHRSCHTMIHHNNNLYLFFGEAQEEYIFSKLIVKYNLNEDSITYIETKKSPFTRRNHITMKLKNFFFLFGGDYSTIDSNETSCFNLNTNEWNQIEFSKNDTQPSPRRYHCGAVDEKNETIYIFGGNHFTPQKKHFNDLWELKNNKWNEIKIIGNKKPEPRRYSAMVSNQEYLYLFGGRNDQKRFKDFWKFNKILNKWIEINAKGDCPNEISAHSLISNGNSLYLFGGRDKDISNKLYQYNISLNTWKILDTFGDVPTPRNWHASTVNDRNEMFIQGGFSNSNLDDFYKLNLNSKKNEKTQGDVMLEIEDFFDVLIVF